MIRQDDGEIGIWNGELFFCFPFNMKFSKYISLFEYARCIRLGEVSCKSADGLRQTDRLIH